MGRNRVLADNKDQARVRAEAKFKQKEDRAREGNKAMAEYEAEGRAVRAKSARLKELRLAKEAADREAEPKTKAAPKKKKPSR